MIRRIPLQRKTPLKRTALKRLSYTEALARCGLHLTPVPGEPNVVTMAAAKPTQDRSLWPGGGWQDRAKAMDRADARKKLKRTPLKARSPSKREADVKYRAAKAVHFEKYPSCQHPSGCGLSALSGYPMDLHHKAGRNGPLLSCAKYFATACRAHHDLAKSDPKGSRANGWIVDVSSEEVRAIRRAVLMAE